MHRYHKEISLYFELKDTPASSRESYHRRIDTFIKHLEQHKPAEEVSFHDIQQFILYLKKEKGLAAGTINNYISAIKFFYTHVLNRDWDSKQIPLMRRKAKLPLIPPREDILRILNETDNLKHKAFLSLLYGSGLRVGEVVRLKISDICSKTMRIRVENAKHDTNRYTILSETTLQVLRDYFREYFTKGYKLDDWLFPGQKPGEHLNVKTIKNTLIKLRNRFLLDRSISAHTLRRSFATHALEDGTDPAFIQQLLGHKRINTTMSYLNLTSKSLMGIKSPLDNNKGSSS